VVFLEKETDDLEPRTEDQAETPARGQEGKERAPAEEKVKILNFKGGGDAHRPGGGGGKLQKRAHKHSSLFLRNCGRKGTLERQGGKGDKKRILKADVHERGPPLPAFTCSQKGVGAFRTATTDMSTDPCYRIRPIQALEEG